MNRRTILASAMSLACLHPAFASEPAIFTTTLGEKAGVAVGGYDTVSYFQNGDPQLGKTEFATSWQGVSWRFANAANLAAFQANPEKYAPQYGGYCADGVAAGDAASSNPLAWTIVRGKLYLNSSTYVRKTWLSNVEGKISKADANWPAVLH